MKYLLGVHAGRKETVAVLTDLHGEVKGVGRAENGDHISDKYAITHVCQAVNRALMGKRHDFEIMHAVFSMVNAEFPEDIEKLSKELNTAFHEVGGRFTVISDSLAALFAGSQTALGVVITAGTFANAAARHDVRGRVYEWSAGSYLQYAGAAELGKRAQRQMVAASIGVEPQTTLTRAILHANNMNSVDEWLYHWNRTDRCLSPQFLAPAVLNQAAEGDAVAKALVECEATRLAEYAKAAAEKVGLVRYVPVVLSGSLFRHESKLLSTLIAEKLAKTLPSCRVEVSDIHPVGGAILRAFELNGGGSSVFIRQKLTATLKNAIAA